jgi:hypothetical protein
MPLFDLYHTNMVSLQWRGSEMAILKKAGV